jgi:hypothetical protein
VKRGGIDVLKIPVEGDIIKHRLMINFADGVPDPYFAIKNYLGGYPERVVIGDYRTRERWDNVRMLVDEDGRLKRLLANPRASILYGAPAHGTYIYGDVLIVEVAVGGDGYKSITPPWTVRYFDEYFETIAKELFRD